MKYLSSFLMLFIICGLSSKAIYAQGEVWQRHSIDNSLNGADGVRLADINKDGLEDIVTGWEESGQSKVYLHPGYESVKNRWPSVIVGKAPDVEDAVFADLDNDGTLDVISSTEGTSRSLYIHWGPTDIKQILEPSAWKSQILPASKKVVRWMFTLPLQLDGKNGLDIVAGAKGTASKIGWFEAPKNSKNLHQWKWHPISTTSWIMSIIARDMDFDGDMDIVISDRKPTSINGVRWLENPGPIDNQKGEWKNHLIACNGLEVMFMDMGDLDGDGLEDAVVTEYSNQQIVYLKRLDKSGLNWQKTTIDIPAENGRAKAVKIGDINGDGISDLVHATNTLQQEGKEGIIWISFDKDPTNSKWKWHHLSGPEGYKFDRIELLDIDGDGDLDVLTCEENFGPNSEGLGIVWYENPF
jgi:hypothetical protein